MREPTELGLNLDINQNNYKEYFDIVHAHCLFTSGLALQIAKKEYTDCRDVPFEIHDDFKQVLKIDAFAKPVPEW